MLRKNIKKFWQWYGRFERWNTVLAAGLFMLQLIHLYWLTTDVVFFRLAGESLLFDTGPLIRFLLIVVDYTEIPAIITVSLVYISSLKRGRNPKDLVYLIFLNLQWLHIFWITDSVVVQLLSGRNGLFDWNSTVAWIAIAIDYLELPVIFETIHRAARIVRDRVD